MSDDVPQLAAMWAREPGARLRGSRGLDSSKLQSPCIVPRPEGGWRL
jgi:hypothetical protein